MSLDAKRIINGTYGKVILDGEEVAETTGLQAKVNYKFADINRVGELATDKKIISFDGTGSLKMYKVNSRMAIKIGELLKEGKDPRFTITSRLSDPDSFGSETVILSNVLFTDLTLVDWTSAKEGTIEAPFVFTKYDLRDEIDPQ